VGLSDYVRVIGFDCNPQILCTHDDGTYWPELHTLFHEELISWGVLIPWITVTWSHGPDEINRTIDAMGHAMRRVRRVLENGAVETSFTGPAVKPVLRPYNRCRQSRCNRIDPDAPQLSCCRENGFPEVPPRAAEVAGVSHAS
jgi:glutamate-1-semialdehyde 2,1-aminomutase